VKGAAIKLISAHAKKTWDKAGGEKWTNAIKRASKELKLAGKI
jgi:hypothetical protein